METRHPKIFMDINFVEIEARKNLQIKAQISNQIPRKRQIAKTWRTIRRLCYESTLFTYFFPQNLALYFQFFIFVIVYIYVSISLLIFYLLVNVYLVLLLWVPRWILYIHLDILLEVPLGGRCPISSRHLGTFLLFHLLYCHLFTLLYICYIYIYYHLHPLYLFIIPFTFMFIPMCFIYLSSHLHFAHPHPLYLLHSLSLLFYMSTPCDCLTTHHNDACAPFLV